ncbi:hypothetical protein [Streptomyces sp. NPDC007264]|uniref:hypothetical protein n=1 Tax=Streptomyces sp. NPDC007264 TaxID=3364777 RepID=UPI0036DDE38A
MTPPSALPPAGPALRTMRTAAGRRALHLALLVGGLLALGLLCGERAQAADGAPPAPTTSVAPMTAGTPADAVRAVVDTVGRTGRSLGAAAGRAVTAPSSPLGRLAPAADAGHASDGRLPRPGSGPRPARPSGALATEPGTAPATRPSAPVTRSVPTGPGTPAGDPVTSVTGTLPAVFDSVSQAVRPVTDGLVRPVADTVVRPVGDLLQTVTGGLADAPAPWPPLSSLPSLPGLPSVPGLPELPELPGPSTGPGHTLPVPAMPQQPGGGTAQRDTVEHRHGGDHGPRATGAVVTAGQQAHRALHLGRSAHLPRHQAPGGEPTGALDGQPATDGGAPRHDGHAVAGSRRAPLRLVPGATAVVTADGTRDRHRDILEFPG